MGSIGGRPEPAADLRQLGARHLRHLHPPLHRQSGLGFAQTSRVSDRTSRGRFEIDGPAQSEHGGFGDGDDGDDKVDRSPAGVVRLGAGHWISV